MLGQREPEIYGPATLEDIEALCAKAAKAVGYGLAFRQSNHEGQLVDWIQEASSGAAGIIVNAGAYTHTSVAIHDALAAATSPIIEVHLSNIHAREHFRRRSYISRLADGVIFGLGPYGYVCGINAIHNILSEKG